MTTEREGVRIEVTSGHPTEAELAAVVAAIARHLRAAAAATPRRPAEASRWIRAARLEVSGHPPIDSPIRLTQQR